VLGGCLTLSDPDPDLARRHVAVRAEFAAGDSAQPAAVLDGWLGAFDDPVLRELVHRAWERNPDLHEAAGRVAEAAARLRSAAGLLYPVLAATGNVQRYDSGAFRTGAGDPIVTDPLDAYSVGVQVAWEVDLWGKLGADRRAAVEAAAAAGWELVQARHSIAAAVAEAYFAVTAARAQLEIDSRLLEAEEFTLLTTRQRVAVGVAPTLDEDLAAANVELAHAALEQDRRALAEAKRALELLLGDYPAALVEAAEVLPDPPPMPATGVPADVLDRRPDLLAAAARVDAAFYGVERARAARLPSLTLSAGGGALIDPDELFWSIAADLFAPIFEGGRLAAEVAAASAQQQQAIARYVATALRAFREVEDALAGERSPRRSVEHLGRASERLRAASLSAENRYEQGLLTIIDLQQVRRQDFGARSELVNSRFQVLRQRLRLYLALGGTVEVEANGMERETDDGR